MKRTIKSCTFLLMVIMAIATLAACGGAPSIVGFWKTEVECDTWTFNFDKDGSYTATHICALNAEVERTTGSYFISGSSVVLKQGNDSSTMDYYLSSKDKALVLENVDKNIAGGNSRFFTGNFWLEKEPLPSKNAFTGIWSIEVDGTQITLEVEGSNWMMWEPDWMLWDVDESPTPPTPSGRRDYGMIMTASYRGSTAELCLSYYDEEEEIGKATVSGNKLTLTIDGEVLIFTKR